jgi:hypothetical protein
MKFTGLRWEIWNNINSFQLKTALIPEATASCVVKRCSHEKLYPALSRGHEVEVSPSSEKRSDRRAVLGGRRNRRSRSVIEFGGRHPD